MSFTERWSNLKTMSLETFTAFCGWISSWRLATRLSLRSVSKSYFFMGLVHLPTGCVHASDRLRFSSFAQSNEGCNRRLWCDIRFHKRSLNLGIYTPNAKANRYYSLQNGWWFNIILREREVNMHIRKPASIIIHNNRCKTWTCTKKSSSNEYEE